jgi:hypothetical protein
MSRELDRQVVAALFDALRASFPQLRMDLQLEHAQLDLNMDIPEQPGLGFDVNLNLQGDELHLSTGRFWLEWFPCTKPDVREQYREAVAGVLSGRYRIVEHYLGGRAVKAQLQRPLAEGWETIGTWANLGALVPWPKRTSVRQNLKSGASRPTMG